MHDIVFLYDVTLIFCTSFTSNLELTIMHSAISVFCEFTSYCNDDYGVLLYYYNI